jgi:hypothetical protein
MTPSQFLDVMAAMLFILAVFVAGAVVGAWVIAVLVAILF